MFNNTHMQARLVVWRTFFLVGLWVVLLAGYVLLGVLLWGPPPPDKNTPKTEK